MQSIPMIRGCRGLRATGCSHLLGKHCGSLPSWLCQSINSQGSDKIRTWTDRYLNKAAYPPKDVGGCRQYVRMHTALMRLPLALADRIFCCSWRLSSQWFGFCTSLDKQSAQSQGLAHEWVTVEDGYNRYWQKAGNRSLANQHFVAVRYSVIGNRRGDFNKMILYERNRRAEQCWIIVLIIKS